MTKCTPTKRAKVVRMHEKEKMDFHEIADKLGLKRPTVSQNYYQVVASGDPYHYEPKSGCPRHFSPWDMPQAARMIESGEAHDGSDVQHVLFPEAPARTVCQALQEISLNGRVHTVGWFWFKPWFKLV
ncbi:hypothetical protein C8R45DRAFT_828510 [Mycena sanguinolenta]|nr:hypothetical protein C8R45DRAFT_828510 [Mycena sanguinolenta]